MFRRKPQEVVHTTKIELSDASRQALVALDNDLQAVRELITDVLESSTRILHALTQEITVQIPVGEDTDDAADVLGVEVFEHEAKRASKKHHAPPPGKPWPMTQNPNEDLLRSSPFTRAPRGVQVTWLKTQVLNDGQWHAAIRIAREYANDERHFRYLRGAVGGRLKEMHEEHMVERRDSHVVGSMYEYRLIK